VQLAKPEIKTEPQDDDFIMPMDDDAPLHPFSDTNSVYRKLRNQANATVDGLRTR
jgi:hypothetical protein